MCVYWGVLLTARYSLIIRDQTYLKILQEAAKEGKTFGKKVNEILNSFALNTLGKPIKNTQCYCGKEAVYEEYWPNDVTLKVCRIHLDRSCKGYKEIVKNAVQS